MLIYIASPCMICHTLYINLRLPLDSFLPSVAQKKEKKIDLLAFNGEMQSVAHCHSVSKPKKYLAKRLLFIS